MPMFNPNGNHGDGGGGESKVVPPGRYVVAWKNHKRRQAKSGHDSIGIVWAVLTGDEKGSEFWTNVSLHPRALWKMAHLCKAFGIQESFEIGATSEGTAAQGDAEITRLLKGHGLVIQVSRRRRPSGDGEDNELERVIAPTMYSSAEVEAIRQARESFLDKHGDPSDYGGDDDFGPTDYGNSGGGDLYGDGDAGF